MLKIKYTNKFKKDLKRALKRGYPEKKLERVVTALAKEERLPAKCRDHLLENSRGYENVRECHISPDWLLVYRIEKDLQILRLVRTGTHSDLF